ncbi:hypothetical protein SGPA1_21731 [Streptomyces misionensis JCM 4497]
MRLPGLRLRDGGGRQLPARLCDHPAAVRGPRALCRRTARPRGEPLTCPGNTARVTARSGR